MREYEAQPGLADRQWMQSEEQPEAIDAAEIAIVAADSDLFPESTKAKCDTSVELYPRWFKEGRPGTKNVNIYRNLAVISSSLAIIFNAALSHVHRDNTSREALSPFARASPRFV